MADSNTEQIQQLLRDTCPDLFPPQDLSRLAAVLVKHGVRLGNFQRGMVDASYLSLLRLDAVISPAEQLNICQVTAELTKTTSKPSRHQRSGSSISDGISDEPAQQQRRPPRSKISRGIITVRAHALAEKWLGEGTFNRIYLSHKEEIDKALQAAADDQNTANANALKEKRRRSPATQAALAFTWTVEAAKKVLENRVTNLRGHKVSRASGAGGGAAQSESGSSPPDAATGHGEASGTTHGAPPGTDGFTPAVSAGAAAQQQQQQPQPQVWRQQQQQQQQQQLSLDHEQMAALLDMASENPALVQLLRIKGDEASPALAPADTNDTPLAVKEGHAGVGSVEVQKQQEAAAKGVTLWVTAGQLAQGDGLFAKHKQLEGEVMSVPCKRLRALPK